MANLFDTFVEYYNKEVGRDPESDKLWELEKIYRSYGLDENSGDMYECFTALPEDAQEEVIELLTPELQVGEPGYAKELYEACLEDKRRGYGYFCDGVIDFYEALKAEGIDLGF